MLLFGLNNLSAAINYPVYHAVGSSLGDKNCRSFIESHVLFSLSNVLFNNIETTVSFKDIASFPNEFLKHCPKKILLMYFSVEGKIKIFSCTYL